MQVGSLGREDPLEEGMTTHFMDTSLDEVYFALQ